MAEPTKPKQQNAAVNIPRYIIPPELAPLEPLLRNPGITEVMINDLRNVMVESGGKMAFSGLAFKTPEELNRVVRSLLDMIGKVLGPENPIAEGSLPDGSRVHIIGPPLTLGGPCVTIRRFPTQRYSIENLISGLMLDRKMGYFLNACIVARMNILIAGGTGSGKTTLLNAMTGLIPKGERLITIEDVPELKMGHFNSVRLLTKGATANQSAIEARELVATALRMRPDRIIVGECRKAEAFDMLQAMNTGHSGSMATLHANSTRDALSRLETLCLLAGSDLPLMAVRRQMASAIDLIVQVQRFRDGSRRLVQISELTGMEQDVFTLQDIFMWENNQFKGSGLIPTFLPRFKEHGIDLPRDFFA